jgi:WD40 repeat protein
MAEPAEAPANKLAEPAVARGADLPAGATARMGTAQFRHGEAIFFIQYTPDGRHLLTAGRDRAIRLWDRATGREVRRFERPAARKAADLKPAKMVPPGTMVMRSPAAPDDQFPVALAPDGKRVAAARDTRVFVWDADTGEKVHELDAGDAVIDVFFTPDGRSLVTVGADQAVTFRDPATGKATQTLRPKDPPMEGENAVVSGRAVSPDGKYLVVHTFEPGTGNATLKVHDLAAGEEAGEVMLAVGGIQNLAFSPDGKYVAWAGFLDGVVVWDLAARKEATRFGGEKGGPKDTPRSLRFSPDGKTLAVVQANDAIELWDVAGGKKLRAIGGHEAERSGGRVVKIILGRGSQMTTHDVAFAPDGKTVAASLGNASVRQFDADTGTEVAPTPGHATGVIAVGSDGAVITTVSKESVRVWDAATGREVRNWPLNPPAIVAAVSPDGKRLATAAGGSRVVLWDPATGQKVKEIDTERADVAGLGFSPDGKFLATKAGVSSVLNLWDAATGKHLRTLGQDGESEFAGGRVTIEMSGVRTPMVEFSADGRLVAAAGDKKQLCVWDAASGTLVREFPAGQQMVAGFALSPNGQCLATLTAGGAVTVYEVATGEKRYELKAPARPPEAFTPGGTGGVMTLTSFTRGSPNSGGVAFTPDGRFVVASAGPAARAWDVLTGQEVTQLKGHQGSVSHLRVAPGGRHLVSGSVDTTAVVWDLGRFPRVEFAAEAAPAAADLDALWADLAKWDSAAAFASTRRLLTDRNAAVALVADRVRPVSAVDDERVAKLIADLGGKFDDRRKAAAELERLGELAVPHLRKALEGKPPLDVRQRVEQLLDKVAAHKPQPEQLRELRAVELLELAGTPEAKRVLDALAKGAAGARLTRDAKAAADRMAAR